MASFDPRPVRALHVHDRLYERFLKVREQAGIGHVRDDLADESLRVWVVFSYLIIYVYHPDTRPVQVVRVLHGARDAAGAFEEDRE